MSEMILEMQFFIDFQLYLKEQHSSFPMSFTRFFKIIFLIQSNDCENLPFILQEYTRFLNQNFQLAATRSSRKEVFCKKDVLKNVAKFTGKDLCQSLGTIIL